MARVEELGFEETLKPEVVEKGLCALCGTCVSFCPFEVIRMGARGPELVDNCLRCGNCYHVCPRYEFDEGAVEEFAFGRTRRPDEEFGVYRTMVLARSKDEEVLKVCQDGGVVSTILKYLVENGEALSAVLSGVKEGSPWLPEPRIALSGPEILRCAGSRYTYTFNMMGSAGVATLLGFLEGKRAAFVGLPCQVRALRKVQMLPVEELGWGRAIGPIIGLFCTETFEQEGFMAFLKDRLGITPEEVVKMNIKKGRMYFYLKDGSSKNVRVKELHELVREGCRTCTDFSAELADISVGSLGLEGWNVVIVRSGLGEEVFRAVVDAGLLEVKEAGPEVLNVLLRLVRMKRKRAPEAGKAGEGEKGNP